MEFLGASSMSLQNITTGARFVHEAVAVVNSDNHGHAMVSQWIPVHKLNTISFTMDSPILYVESGFRDIGRPDIIIKNTKGSYLPQEYFNTMAR